MPRTPIKTRSGVGMPVKLRGSSNGNGSAKRIRSAKGSPTVPLSESGKVTQSTFECFLAAELDVPVPVAHECWKKLLGLIRVALRRGHPVSLTNIGTLEAYRKKGTSYRHPTSGEIQRAERRKALRLFTSPNMREFLRA